MLSHIEFYTFTIRYFRYLSTSQNEKSRTELKLGKELAHVLFHNSSPYLREVLPCAFSVIWHFHCVCFYRTVFVCISQSHCLLLQSMPGRSGLIPLSEPWKCIWTQIWAVWYTHKCTVESREDWNYCHACFFSFISSSHCRSTDIIAVGTLKYFREKPQTQPCETQYFHFMIIKFVRVLLLHLHKINMYFNSIKDRFLVKKKVMKVIYTVNFWYQRKNLKIKLEIRKVVNA